MKSYKRYLSIVCLSIVCITGCSKKDDFGHRAKYSFVGDTYVHQWTLQNTNADFQYVLHFATDSTFTLTPIRVETGESMRDKPAEGMYIVDNDGNFVFAGVNSYLTRIRGQRITLYRGKFDTDSHEVLSIDRYLEFNTGNSRRDWIDFYKK